MSDDPPLHPGSIRAILRTIAEVSALLGGVLYGLGWLFFLRFYAAFRITPEDAGVNFAFVVVRVGLVLALAILVVSVLAFFLGQQGRLQTVFGLRPVAVRQRVFVLLYLVAEALFFLVEVAAIVWLRPWTLGGALGIVLPIVLLIGALFLLYYQAAAVLIIVKYSADQTSVKIERPIVAAVILVLTLGLLAGAALLGAKYAAGRARTGSETALLGVRVERVSVLPAVNVRLPDSFADPSCTFLLGEHEGTYVLLNVESREVLFVSTETVMLLKSLDSVSCRDILRK
jgi:hypothetical protein